MSSNTIQLPTDDAKGLVENLDGAERIILDAMVFHPGERELLTRALVKIHESGLMLRDELKKVERAP